MYQGICVSVSAVRADIVFFLSKTDNTSQIHSRWTTSLQPSQTYCHVLELLLQLGLLHQDFLCCILLWLLSLLLRPVAILLLGGCT